MVTNAIRYANDPIKLRLILDRTLICEVSDASSTSPHIRRAATTDEGGRQIRAGLELWVGKDDDYPFRGTGEVVAGSTLELGALRLDVAFFRWHVDGRTGTGHYDVIRHA